MLVLFVAAAKLFAVKACTSVDQARLPCWLARLVLCPLLALLLKRIFCELICFGQSTFLDVCGSSSLFCFLLSKNKIYVSVFLFEFQLENISACTTLSAPTFSSMAFSLVTFSILTHSNTQHSNNQHIST